MTFFLNTKLDIILRIDLLKKSTWWFKFLSVLSLFARGISLTVFTAVFFCSLSKLHNFLLNLEAGGLKVSFQECFVEIKLKRQISCLSSRYGSIFIKDSRYCFSGPSGLPSGEVKALLGGISGKQRSLSSSPGYRIRPLEGISVRKCIAVANLDEGIECLHPLPVMSFSAGSATYPRIWDD